MAQDGDWVRARPLGWDDREVVDNVMLGSVDSRGTLTGMLTIIESAWGVQRHAVDGITVDPATITVVDPPAN